MNQAAIEHPQRYAGLQSINAISGLGASDQQLAAIRQVMTNEPKPSLALIKIAAIMALDEGFVPSLKAEECGKSA